MKQNNRTTGQGNVKRLVLAALFLALGMVLPFLTGQIRQFGSMLLPMHLPVLLCGFLCSWRYGLAVGAILPLLRSVTFGMPPIYPMALSMAFELAAYGFLSGFLYEKSRWKCLRALYRCLILSMLGGRVVWGVVQALLLGLGENGFGMQAFVAGAFLNAIPGILLQLSLIPILMVLLGRTGLIVFARRREDLPPQ